MSVNFNESETKVNLMRAFAGESMARNRYTFSADIAKQQKLYVLETLFQFTAGQEQQHAKIFYDHLSSLSGETVIIDGGYPVDHYEDMIKLLLAARHNEFEEFDPVYPEFAKVAEEEGFPQVAFSFHQIAQVEKSHGMRFEYFADLMEGDQLFSSNQEEKWICLNCGYIYEGKDAPKICPVCKHDQGYFVTEKTMFLLH